MKDYAKADRQALIAGSPEFNRALAVRKAIARLGTRYVFHPDNRVKRAPHRQPENSRTDVARTVARFAKRTGLDLA